MQGYWWLSMQKQALEFSKIYDQCQRFAPSIHQPGGPLNPISSPWPFAQWGLDIVGPFPRATSNRRWLLIGTNYFTKWVEVKPLANIWDTDVKWFVNGLVYRKFSYQIMVCNLIVRLFYGITRNWGLLIGTLRRLILRAIGRPKQPISPLWMAWRRGRMIRKDDGPKNFQVCCGHMGPFHSVQLKKLISQWPMV